MIDTVDCPKCFASITVHENLVANDMNFQGHMKWHESSPDPLASIAESLERVVRSNIDILDHLTLRTPDNSESEKFFRHLNNGEVVLMPVIPDGAKFRPNPLSFRITITEKGLPA